jgi:hypothetical protein
MGEVRQISDDRLGTLADDPRNVVYKYNDLDSLPADKIRPLPEVRRLVLGLWDEVRHLRTERFKVEGPLSSFQSQRLRYWILKKSAERDQWRAFSATHPMIFDRCLHRDTTQREVDALLHMIDMKMGTGTAQQLQTYIMDTFAVSEKEYRKKHKGEEVRVVDIKK